MASSSDMIVLFGTERFPRNLFLCAIMSFLIDNSSLDTETINWFRKFNDIRLFEVSDYSEIHELKPHLFNADISIFYRDVLENIDGFRNPFTNKSSRIFGFDEIETKVQEFVPIPSLV